MSNDPKYQIESSGDKWKRKLEQNPFVAGGLVGFVCALGYGVYAYRNKGKMSTSIFLMQLRVSAQGMVVGALAIGMMWETAKLIYKRQHEPDE